MTKTESNTAPAIIGNTTNDKDSGTGGDEGVGVEEENGLDEGSEGVGEELGEALGEAVGVEEGLDEGAREEEGEGEGLAEGEGVGVGAEPAPFSRTYRTAPNINPLVLSATAVSAWSFSSTPSA